MRSIIRVTVPIRRLRATAASNHSFALAIERGTEVCFSTINSDGRLFTLAGPDQIRAELPHTVHASST